MKAYSTLAQKRLGGAVAHAPNNAVGQGSVNRRVSLAEDACRFRRVDERHPAE